MVLVVMEMRRRSNDGCCLHFTIVLPSYKMQNDRGKSTAEISYFPLDIALSFGNKR